MEKEKKVKKELVRRAKVISSKLEHKIDEMCWEDIKNDIEWIWDEALTYINAMNNSHV